jgi:hypothetical protein
LNSTVPQKSAIPLLAILPQGQETNREHSAQCEVGKNTASLSALSDAQQELDDAIRQLQTLAALAEDRGDVLTAMDYSRRMAAAIKSRTPEHVQRLEQASWQRSNRKEWAEVLGEVGEQPGCFFDVCGAAIRRRMG